MERKTLERKDSKIERKDAKKQGKTFNRLDAKFQLQAEHSEDHVFQEELEMLAEMRQKNPEFATLEDKFLLACLFSRRHNVQGAIELVQNHLKVREKVGFKEKLPSKGDCNQIWEQGFIYHRPRIFDKHGRQVYYYFMGKDFANKRTTELDWAYAFYDCYDSIQNEPVSALRNGAIYIVDMQEFGWRNLDFSSRGRENSRNMTGLFPKRMRALYVVNHGVLFMAALKAAKLILPKKIHKRIHALSLDELRELIPEQNLHPKYGGKLELTA
jgi:hypothetical protein